MAIQEITSTELVQRCAKCDRENRIVLADLEVGLERDDQVEDSVVPLPEPDLPVARVSPALT